MARFWSKESVQQTIDVMNADKEHLELAGNLSGKVVIRVLDDPDGNDIYASFSFEKGKCVDWTYDAEETCYVLEGEVTVTPEGGEPVTIGRGDLVTFPKGMRCVWDISAPIRKHCRFD